jgi:hypothetical protein
MIDRGNEIYEKKSEEMEIMKLKTGDKSSE